jgi:hypothetical protein
MFDRPRDTHDSPCPLGCNLPAVQALREKNERLRRVLTPGTDEHETAVERLAPVAGRAAARELLAALAEML